MTATDIASDSLVFQTPIREVSPCASSSPVRPAGSAPPSSPSCSPPATRSSAWPAPTPSAAAIAAAGAEVRRGDLDDLDGLRDAAAASDGVIHLAFKHDRLLRRLPRRRRRRPARRRGHRRGAGRLRPAVGDRVGRRSGSRPAAWRPRTDGRRRPGVAGGPRVARDRGSRRSPSPTRGVRSSVVRLAPTVHGDGDQASCAMLVGIARDKGVVRLRRRRRQPLAGRAPPRRRPAVPPRASSSAPAGSSLHGVAEEGVPFRDIAEAIGRGLGVPVGVGRRRATRRALRLARRGSSALDSPASSALHPRAARLAADRPRPDRRPRRGPLLPHPGRVIGGRVRAPRTGARTVAQLTRPARPRRSHPPRPGSHAGTTR